MTIRWQLDGDQQAIRWRSTGDYMSIVWQLDGDRQAIRWQPDSKRMMDGSEMIHLQSLCRRLNFERSRESHDRTESALPGSRRGNRNQWDWEWDLIAMSSCFSSPLTPIGGVHPNRNSELIDDQMRLDSRLINRRTVHSSGSLGWFSWVSLLSDSLDYFEPYSPSRLVNHFRRLSLAL